MVMMAVIMMMLIIMVMIIMLVLKLMRDVSRMEEPADWILNSSIFILLTLGVEFGHLEAR